MINLKEETLFDLREHGKTPEDIRWIGCKEFTIPVERFWELADVQYDDGYGHAHVFMDLLIVGDDWWLERHEYDGAEWWEFKTLPCEPFEEKKVAGVLDLQIRPYCEGLRSAVVIEEEET